jgi:hypothetical protein
LVPDVAPRHIYEYACVTKSLQLRVSPWFSAPRYGFYCTIWVKNEDILANQKPPVDRLCRNYFLVIASDRRERGNLYMFNAL